MVDIKLKNPANDVIPGSDFLKEALDKQNKSSHVSEFGRKYARHRYVDKAMDNLNYLESVGDRWPDPDKLKHWYYEAHLNKLDQVTALALYVLTNLYAQIDVEGDAKLLIEGWIERYRNHGA